MEDYRKVIKKYETIHRNNIQDILKIVKKIIYFNKHAENILTAIMKNFYRQAALKTSKNL